METKDDTLVYHIARDWRAAGLNAQDTAMLAYVEKLTRTPGQVNQQDVDTLRAEGFDDRQVLDIVLVCAMFNFMTRIADGTGTRAEESWRANKQRKDAAVETWLEAELGGQTAQA